MKTQEEKIIKENWTRINELMDLRTKQFKDIYEDKWWENLIEDKLYNFLCHKLVELKQMATKPSIEIKLSEEDVKKLASKTISVEEFIKTL